MTSDTKIRFLLSALILALFAMLFHFHGNSADVHLFGKSIFVWSSMRWSGSLNGALKYCYLIPPISIMLVFFKRDELAEAKKYVYPKASILITAAILLHIIGLRTSLPRLSLTALILLLWSIPWYLAGDKVARLILFPCGYLFFCIPLTFLDSVTFPMRIFATSASASLLNGLGIEVQRVGTAIFSLSREGFALDVAAPCSGLRYFLVLMALSAVYANLTQKTHIKKVILFCLAPVIAIAANVIRILLIAIVSEFFGQEIATGIYHDWSGYIVFISAVFLLLVTSRLLNTNIRQTLNSWKEKHTNTTSR